MNADPFTSQALVKLYCVNDTTEADTRRLQIRKMNGNIETQIIRVGHVEKDSAWILWNCVIPTPTSGLPNILLEYSLVQNLEYFSYPCLLDRTGGNILLAVDQIQAPITRPIFSRHYILVDVLFIVFLCLHCYRHPRQS